jgi:hypothetical protein
MKSITNTNQDLQITIVEEDLIIENKQEIGSANMLLSQLPTLIGAQQLSNAYKVVFPAGIVGNLMNLKNGLQSSTIVNGSGKIVGQAGLQSLSNLASPMVVFSAISMITGQYFMAQINKSIQNLTKKIEKIEKQLTIKEESIVFSASIFIKEIRNNWTLIVSNEDYKASIITNIISTINELTSSCYYFQNILNDKLSDLETSYRSNKLGSNNLINDIKRTEDFLKYAYQLRSSYKLILLFLTTNITNNNATEIKEVLKKDFDLVFSSTVNQLEARVDSIIDILKQSPSIKLQQQTKKIGPIIVDIRSIVNERYNNEGLKNINSTIDKVKNIDSNGQDFYIIGNKMYIDEIVEKKEGS